MLTYALHLCLQSLGLRPCGTRHVFSCDMLAMMLELESEDEEEEKRKNEKKHVVESERYYTRLLQLWCRKSLGAICRRRSPQSQPRLRLPAKWELT